MMTQITMPSGAEFSFYLSQKRALTIDELALYTGFKKSYLYKLNFMGAIPGASKPRGGRIFFDREKIDQWLIGNPKLSNAELDAAATNYITTGKLRK